MTDQFRSQSFDPGRHDVSSFTCGEPSLDDWLRNQAASAAARGTARTWIWVDRRDVVVAHYALAAHKVSRAQVPRRVGRGGPAEIPAVLLARLALSVELRGTGLGQVLVADALERVVSATRSVGARLVVVDALNPSVATFYERLGFTPIPDSLLLVQKISDIAASLDAPDR